MYSALKKDAAKVRWHMIGSLQTNKINKALRIFDAIQSVESLPKAIAIDRRVERARNPRVPIYIEINIGSEDSKGDIKPIEHEPFDEYIENFVRDISRLGHVRLEGLMTMGPRSGNPEDVRPYFRRTKKDIRENQDASSSKRRYEVFVNGYDKFIQGSSRWITRWNCGKETVE